MSSQKLQEVEIITQRIENQQENSNNNNDGIVQYNKTHSDEFNSAQQLQQKQQKDSSLNKINEDHLKSGSDNDSSLEKIDDDEDDVVNQPLEINNRVRISVQQESQSFKSQKSLNSQQQSQVLQNGKSIEVNGDKQSQNKSQFYNRNSEVMSNHRQQFNLSEKQDQNAKDTNYESGNQQGQQKGKASPSRKIKKSTDISNIDYNKDDYVAENNTFQLTKGRSSNLEKNRPQAIQIEQNRGSVQMESNQSISVLKSPNKGESQRNSSRKNINGQKIGIGTEKEEDKNIFDDGYDDEKKSNFPKIEAMIESYYYQFFVTIVTIYALFGDDIRVLTTNKHADDYFDGFTIFSLTVFAVEIFLCMLSKPGYTWSFFFWLDIISTVSLLLDIQILSNAIFYGGESTSNSVDASQFAQAGKASRVGTKAGRVVRLVRLIRIVKLYKLSQEQAEIQQQQKQKLLSMRQEKKKKKRQSRAQNQNNQKESDSCSEGENSVQRQSQQYQNYPNGAVVPLNYSLISQQKKDSITSPRDTKRESGGNKDQLPPESLMKESRVSKTLSDLTTKRVIVIVLLLLFLMPLFSADYYYSYPSSMDFATKHIVNIAENSETTQKDLEDLYDTIVKVHLSSDIQFPLMYLRTPFTFLKNYQDDDFENLRNDEQDKYEEELDINIFRENHTQSQFQVNLEDEIDVMESMDADEVSLQGILSTRKTNILTAGLSLARTFYVCVVLTCGALFFSKDANDLALRPIERLIDKVNKIAKNPISAKEQQLIKEEGDNLETIIIENAIVKIGVLLALGFGDAGSEIIGSNMQKTGDVDPMLPGQKKCAIYGFCDIRNFTDATEVLQEDVMLFVNNIGEVVHSMTDRYQGAANKNIGDAFLLVWKIPGELYTIDEENSIFFKDQAYISKLCDMSLLCFVKIQVKLNREPKILKYRQDKRLEERMPNYKVKMGYGLHIGWGIEGAIGSQFKIDASYLSPNVNMAARLEAATKQFGTPILVSSALYSQFTPEMKDLVRFIDRVTVKGSNQPIGLYTIDVNVDDLPQSKDPEVDYPELTKQDRQEIERQKKLEVTVYLSEPDEWEWNVHDYIQSNKDLRFGIGNIDKQFVEQFDKGFQNYLSGDWKNAKIVFDQLAKKHPNDGPMISLMDVMGETGFQAPNNWPGFRQLTEK